MSILLKRTDLQEALETLKAWKAGGGTYIIQGVLTGEMIFSAGLQFWVDQWPDFNFILLTTGDNYKYKFLKNISGFATKDPSNVRSILLHAKPLRRKELMIGNYPLKYNEVYDELMASWKSTVIFSFQTKLLATNANSLKSFSLPESYRQCALTLEDAAVLNAHWQFAAEGSLIYIKDHIENFPSVGVKNKDGKLVAWELSYYTGAMGMLFVMEEHRHQGLAKFLIYTLAKKLLHLGRIVYCFVEATNTVSLNLHKKCGFSIQEGHDGLLAKVKNDIPDA